MAVESAFSATFVNDGGPLIVLPRELLPTWEGGDEPRDGREIVTEWDDRLPGIAGTDYARACSAQEPVDILSVGSGHGLVVGGPDGMADESIVQWLRIDGVPGVMLLVNMGCDHLEATCTHPELADAPAQEPEAEWTALSRTLRVEGIELVLMHAVSSGHDSLEYVDEGMACIGCAIAFEVAAGTYAVAYREVASPAEAKFRVIRLKPV